jgi:hypothetical protein
MMLSYNENVSRAVVHGLHDVWTQECKALQNPAPAFREGLVYEFSNGLGFRLFDDGGDKGPVIGFVVQPVIGHKKAGVLASIPERLREAGVDNEQALARLSDMIARPDKRSDRG